jgi:hypothetical protein
MKRQFTVFLSVSGSPRPQRASPRNGDSYFENRPRVVFSSRGHQFHTELAKRHSVSYLLGYYPIRVWEV